MNPHDSWDRTVRTCRTIINRDSLRLGPLVLVAATLLGTATHARGGDLKDVVSDLYGGDGIRLGPPPVMGGSSHVAHFTAQSLQGLDELGSGLAGTLGFASFNAVVTGYTLDLETGEPVRTTDSLGPLLAETGTTLGKQKLNVGFSFTRSKFKRFDGRDTDSLVLLFDHPDVPGMPDFELDKVRVDLDLDVTQEVYAMFATYGLTENWDVGIILPVIRMRVTADGSASIVDNTPTIDAGIHFFDPGGPDPLSDDPRSRISRSKTGIGDIALRSKYNFSRNDPERPDMAISGQIVLPTGDQDNLLGTGETRLQALFIVSKAIGAFTPHANIGYEWAPGDHQLNSLRYVAGFDVVVDPKLTTAIDILGRWEHSGDDIGDHIIDAAVGAKWNIVDTTLINFYLLFPLNRDEGLRADVVWSIGVEHTF